MVDSLTKPVVQIDLYIGAIAMMAGETEEESDTERRSSIKKMLPYQRCMIS